MSAFQLLQTLQKIQPEDGWAESSEPKDKLLEISSLYDETYKSFSQLRERMETDSLSTILDKSRFEIDDILTDLLIKKMDLEERLDVLNRKERSNITPFPSPCSSPDLIKDEGKKGPEEYHLLKEILNQSKSQPREKTLEVLKLFDKTIDLFETAQLIQTDDPNIKMYGMSKVEIDEHLSEVVAEHQQLLDYVKVELDNVDNHADNHVEQLVNYQPTSTSQPNYYFWSPKDKTPVPHVAVLDYKEKPLQSPLIKNLESATWTMLTRDKIKERYQGLLIIYREAIQGAIGRCVIGLNPQHRQLVALVSPLNTEDNSITNTDVNGNMSKLLNSFTRASNRGCKFNAVYVYPCSRSENPDYILKYSEQVVECYGPRGYARSLKV